MEYSGNINLFTSHFVIGTLLPNNKEFEIVQILHDWIDFKDSDYGMRKYSTNRTQYISFPHVIELPTINLVLKDLVKIYKKSYPFGKKADFIEHTFGYTLFDLQRFISFDSYIPYANPLNSKVEIYSKSEPPRYEYLDFVIDDSKDIEFYKQYFKKVIEIINNINFDYNLMENSLGDSFLDEIFITNNRNYLNLQEEYNLTTIDADFIHHTFWPIHTLNKISPSQIENLLIQHKNRFNKNNGIFDIDIFIRNELSITTYQLTKYYDCLTKGKAIVWNKLKNDYFHWFKLDSETSNAQTLIISECNEIQLEIYFKQLITIIELFILEERNSANNLIKKSSLENSYKNNDESISSKTLKTENHSFKPQQLEDKIEEVRTIIEKSFSFMQKNDNRQHKLILNEIDFKNLINWVTYYFENNFKIPEINEPIREVNTSKGNVTYAFKLLFKDLHPEKTRPDSLFELIKSCFKEYRNDKISNFRKQKKPQFFDTL
ncbi:hypothetical protein [Maribacter aquivivus]|uniref:hypothetical protein n=1 Tax=Maribacter aquivivus TaxID=228958 RepID=UPI00249405ED|nr:hypothetical protein [Maribacter aquivivus]